MFDFHLDRVPSDGELTAALAAAFAVAPAGIQLASDIASATELTGVSLLCVRFTSGGEFPLHVSVYPQSLDAQFPIETELAQSLTRTLGCRCLVTDDDIDPYLWILIDAQGTRTVSVEPEALDRDEFVLSDEA